MNRHALSYDEVEKYAQRFQQYLQSQGIEAKVEIDTFKTDTQGGIMYSADPDDWSYNDYALTIPAKPRLLHRFAARFLDSLDDTSLRYNIFGDKLVLQK